MKRKRRDDDDENLENRYMHRLRQEEVKEDAQRKREGGSDGLTLEDSIGSVRGEGLESVSKDSKANTGNSSDALKIPQHEALAPSREELGLEKASRTVFLANVSTMAIKSKVAKRTLITHLESFVPSLPTLEIAHKVESFRFRSTAFSGGGLPKKAAYVKKELMDSTTKSTNAYVVYTTKAAARQAVKDLNGTIVLDRHLRVDGVAHPAKIDHRRCVFVGNLSFVDDETTINAAQDEDGNKRPRKGKEPADAEEGLWRQFSKAGPVESVRVVRDKTTRVGKGFAYVQFQASALSRRVQSSYSSAFAGREWSRESALVQREEISTHVTSDIARHQSEEPYEKHKPR